MLPAGYSAGHSGAVCCGETMNDYSRPADAGVSSAHHFRPSIPMNFRINRHRALLCRLAMPLAVFCTALDAAADTRFSISADGQEVTDGQTGLIWRRCAEGMRPGNRTCSGTPLSMTHDAAQQYAAVTSSSSGKAWRLPTVTELTGLIDRSRRAPAIDTVAFPATPSEYFWSSSPFVGERSSVWFVDFADGYVYDVIRGTSHALRLVRAGR